MIRNHPDAIAIALLLFLLPGLCFVRPSPRTNFAVFPIREQIDAERDRFRAEGDKLRAEGEKFRAEVEKFRSEGEKFRVEQQRFAEELRRCFRFRIR